MDCLIVWLSDFNFNGQLSLPHSASILPETGSYALTKSIEVNALSCLGSRESIAAPCFFRPFGQKWRLWMGRSAMGNLPWHTRLQFSSHPGHMSWLNPLKSMSYCVWGLGNPLTAPCFFGPCWPILGRTVLKGRPSLLVIYACFFSYLVIDKGFCPKD